LLAALGGEFAQALVGGSVDVSAMRLSRPWLEAD
jgi:hypothetical protein